MKRLPDYLRNKIKLDPKRGCWLWTGALTSEGYGSVGIPKTKKTTRAHAAVYELLVGPLPRGTQHDHLCRIRHCVNPKHLEPVTGRINVLRGQGIAAKNAAKTKCKHGHSLKDAYVRPDGRGRQCRTCLRLNWKKYDKPYSQRRKPTT